MLTVGQKNSATETIDQNLVFVGTEGGKLLAFRNLIVEVNDPTPSLELELDCLIQAYNCL